jgi:transcriptional regulator with XRE-family HTH domain
LDWLLEKRKSANMTMRQVSAKTGISESAYCLIEKGMRRPSVNTAKKIAKVLNFDWTRFYDTP